MGNFLNSVEKAKRGFGMKVPARFIWFVFFWIWWPCWVVDASVFF